MQQINSTDFLYDLLEDCNEHKLNSLIGKYGNLLNEPQWNKIISTKILSLEKKNFNLFIQRNFIIDERYVFEEIRFCDYDTLEYFFALNKDNKTIINTQETFNFVIQCNQKLINKFIQEGMKITWDKANVFWNETPFKNYYQVKLDELLKDFTL